MAVELNERKLNWTREPEDPRDFKFSLAREVLVLPNSYSLESQLGKVYDQLELGSCTSQAGCSILYQASKKQGREIYGSRLQLYYDCRALDGSVNQDSGSYIRTVFKAMNQTGVAPEDIYPYLISKFKMKPPEEVYTAAAQTKSIRYESLHNNLVELQTAIYQGYPVQFGFDVYSSFMGTWNSIMPMPKAGEQIIGGHGTVLISYSNEKQAFLVRNSWGSDWKDNGNFWMPYSYVTSSHCSDFWILESITEIMDTKLEIIKQIFPLATDMSKLKESTLLRIAALLGVEATVADTKVQIISKISKILYL